SVINCKSEIVENFTLNGSKATFRQTSGAMLPMKIPDSETTGKCDCSDSDKTAVNSLRLLSGKKVRADVSVSFKMSRRDKMLLSLSLVSASPAAASGLASSECTSNCRETAKLIEETISSGIISS